MAFTWRYENTAGEPVEPIVAVEGERAAFPNQGDAESWIGESWPALLAPTSTEGSRLLGRHTADVGDHAPLPYASW